MQSFWISRLRALGKQVKPADVSFSKHLNVISGASDTGKSYILQCIDYMLGAKDPPKILPEAEGYSTLLMEIVSDAEKRYVLKRSLKQGGNFLVFQGGLDDITEDTEGTNLAARHNPKSTETLSSFLLGLSGLGDVVLRKSVSKTRPLSFRDVSKFAIVDETRIISDESPVYPTGQYVQRTGNLSLFNYFVSGEDASSVIAAPDIKIQKASWRAKTELYDQMIRDIEIESLEGKESLESRLSKLDASISELTSIVEFNSTQIAEAQEARAQNWVALHRAMARRTVIDQLLTRFSLLTRHYTSDIERLAFLAEGDHYLSQIGGEAHCPICGALFDGNGSKHPGHSPDQEPTIQVAAKAEIKKLELLRSDLKVTFDALTSESVDIESRVSDLRTAIEANDDRIELELAERQKTSKAELDAILDERRKVASALATWSRLEDYRSQRERLGPEPVRVRSTERVEMTDIAGTGRRKFCDRVQAVLSKWRFPDNGVVEFNQQMDVMVNGVPRSSHGKGIRAILHSAFTITLMLHARDRHPGFVILDSPLTSFRPRDEYQVDEDIQRAFFEHLSKLKEGQIIILENKEPPADLLKNLHYEHFSGDERFGRKGFYPTISADSPSESTSTSVTKRAKKAVKQPVKQERS